MCDSGAVKVKAGGNISSIFNQEPDWFTQVINQAESFINVKTRIDYTAAYSGLSDDKKKILEDVASSKAAMAVINYDMSGFPSKREAETMLDFNINTVDDGINILKEKEATDFISE